MFWKSFHTKVSIVITFLEAPDEMSRKSRDELGRKRKHNELLSNLGVQNCKIPAFSRSRHPQFCLQKRLIPAIEERQLFNVFFCFYFQRG